MKFNFLCSFAALLISSTIFAQSSETVAITKVITEFAQAGDRQDVMRLDDCLDDHYRVIMNQLFGSKDLTTLSKIDYLDKIRQKEFGGDSRKVVVENIIVNGNTASALVTFIGSKLRFVSLITLVQNTDMEWKLVSEAPVIS